MTKMKFKRKFLLLLFLLCAIVTEVGARDVYFCDTQHWGKVVLWAWKDGENIGTGRDMTQVNTNGDGDWYKITIEDKWTGVSFQSENLSKGEVNVGSIRTDLSVLFYKQSQFYEPREILFTALGQSWDVYKVLSWGGGLPGLDVNMTPVPGKDGMYSCYLPNAVENVNFHNSSWSSNSGDQTFSDKYHYIYGKGWAISNEYYVVGSATGGWNSASAKAMTYNPLTGYFQYTIVGTAYYGEFKFRVGQTEEPEWYGGENMKNINDFNVPDWHYIGSQSKSGWNYGIAASTGKIRTIELNPVDNYWHVKYTDAPVNPISKIYFYNTNSWQNVYIWAWKKDPNSTGNVNIGTAPQMTKVSGTDNWYYYDTPDDWDWTSINFQDCPNQIADKNNNPSGNHFTGSLSNIPSRENAYYVDGSGAQNGKSNNGKWARQIIGLQGKWDNQKDLCPWKFAATGSDLIYTIPGYDEVNFNFYLATDNSYVGHGVTLNYNKTEAYFSEDNGNTTNIVVSGNSVRQERNIFYNVLDEKYKLVFAHPMPPMPTLPRANVIPLYTDEYDMGSFWINYWPEWGQSTVTSNEVDLHGKHLLHYTDFNYAGFNFNDIDITNMDFLHIDILPIGDFENGSITIYPESATGDRYHSIKAEYLKPNVWNSINIPLNRLAYVDHEGKEHNYNMQHINNLKFVYESNISDFYLDNVYFGKITDSPDPLPGTTAGIPSSAKFGPEDVYSVYSDYFKTADEFSLFNCDTHDGYGRSSITDTEFSIDHSNKYILWNSTSWGSICKRNNDWTPNWNKWNLPAEYDHLNVDVYSTKETDIYVQLSTSGSSGYDKKDANQKKHVAANTWTTISIDLTKAPYNNGTFKLENVNAINVGANTDEIMLAIDNVYFWCSNYETNEATSVDNDAPKGLNWNTTGGATDFVNRVLYSWIDNSDATNAVKLAAANEAHDGNVNTSTDTKRGVDEGYYIVQLNNRIEVSDVELIWGNGFPKNYDVYVTDKWPVQNNQLDLTGAQKLYSRTDFDIDYAPYYDIESNLSGKSGRFVVVQMHERGNTFFSYALKEVHVGSRENYGGATGLGLDDIRIKNGEANAVNVMPYYTNQRGANVGNASSGVTITAKKNGVECPEFVTVTPKSDGTFTIYATAPGDYTLEMVEGGKTGTAYLYVTQSWTTDPDEARDPKKNYKYTVITENPEVKIAVSHIEEGNEYTLRDNESNNWPELYEPSSYTEQRLIDGLEQKDDNLSRWCSGSSFSELHWPNNDGNVHGPEWALIDLGKNYNLTDFEIIWEEAYARNYAVYGFRNLTEISDKLSDVTDVSTLNFTKEYLLSESDKRTAIKNYTDNASNSHRLFYGENVTPTDVFPMNDIESSIEKEVRYILVKMTEKGTNFGYSIWEFYAGGIPVDELNAMNRLEAVAPDMTIIVNYSGVQSVTAKGEMNGTPVEKVNFEPVEFTVFKEDGVTEVTGKLKFDPRGDGTYLVTGLEVGNYKVKMKGDNKNPSDNFIYGWFNVEVIATKRPMKKDVAKSDDKKLVFDNGYYVEQVLKDEADKKYTIIDMTNVDFTNRYLESQVVEHDGEPTEDDIRDGKIVSKANYATANLSQVTLPAPYTVTEAGGAAKMNPNAVYFTYEPLIKGENVAKQKAGDIWRIKTLRIWDGWDFNPSFDGVGMTVEKYLRFYTHIEPKQYSFIVFPFNVHRSELNAKGVSLFRPVRYDENENTMEIEEVTNDNDGGSAWVGQPYLIYTESDAYKGPSYALTIVGDGSLNLSTAPCTIGNISFTGTYVSTKAPKSNGNETYFWYNTPKNQFSTVTTDDVTIPPFFAYMKVINNTSSAKPANGMRFVLRNDDIVTVVTEVETTNSVQGIYTIGGVKVTDDINELNRLPKGMYIVNGKKIVK